MKKIMLYFTIISVFLGLILFMGGIWGIVFTHNRLAEENIITPSDASIPGAPVLGPLTLMSQSDIIKRHVLKTTNNEYYAEMSSADKDRSLWITATTLITALNLAVIAYTLSALSIILGIFIIALGLVLKKIQK